MACCCDPPPLCPTCEYTCELDPAQFDPLQDGPAFFTRTASGGENPFECQQVGTGGNYKVQNVWRGPGRSGGPTFPAPIVPAFTWNEGFPAKLNGCQVYWVQDIRAAAVYGTNCCVGKEFDPFTGAFIRCAGIVALCFWRGFVRWRLMLLDCEAHELVDITGEALTPLSPFSFPFDDSIGRGGPGCEEEESTSTPEFFPTPSVICDD